MAVLADEETNWRPASYGYSLGGCTVSLEFPVAKLLDYETRSQSLEETTNPFGIVVMAHLKTKATNRNPESRLQWKISLVRSLFERGYNREYVLGLFRFIDWVMVLPEELANSFKAELRSYEEAYRMRYVTSIERLAKQEGIEEGILQTNRENLIEVLETRFGEVPNSIVEVVNQINDPAVLKMLHKRAIAIPSTAEFQQVLQNITSQE